MVFLGIDWGKAKIGLAIGSDEVKIASPFIILNYRNIEELIMELKQIIKSESIDVLVVGQPFSLQGQKSMAKNYQEFVEKLRAINKPIYFEDERLSTKYAASVKKQSQNFKKIGDDDVAAAAILQTFFDRL